MSAILTAREFHVGDVPPDFTLQTDEGKPLAYLVCAYRFVLLSETTHKMGVLRSATTFRASKPTRSSASPDSRANATSRRSTNTLLADVDHAVQAYNLREKLFGERSTWARRCHETP